jgi:hypothetical protein
LRPKTTIVGLIFDQELACRQGSCPSGHSHVPDEIPDVQIERAYKGQQLPCGICQKTGFNKVVLKLGVVDPLQQPFLGLDKIYPRPRAKCQGGEPLKCFETGHGVDGAVHVLQQERKGLGFNEIPQEEEENKRKNEKSQLDFTIIFICFLTLQFI